MRTHIDITLDKACLFQVALMMLIFPLRWVIGLFLAIAVHECGHFLALKLMKVPVMGISAAVFGMKINTATMSLSQEIIAALAGPLGGAVLLFAGRVFPEAAVCAWFQTVFNLIPVYPLDGGRVLSAVLRTIFGEIRGRSFASAIGVIICTIAALLSVYAVRYLGLLAFVPLFILIKQSLFSAGKGRVILDKCNLGAKLVSKEKNRRDLYDL